MKFKRLRVIKGNSLTIPVKDVFETVIKAELTNGSGIPLSRFEYNTSNNSFSLPSAVTQRLSGTYKYQLTVTKGLDVETILYGIIEVL
ncbi:TPA: hypothetical protein ACPVXB_001028 [Vibrio parahaemolyticus]